MKRALAERAKAHHDGGIGGHHRPPSPDASGASVSPEESAVPPPCKIPKTEPHQDSRSTALGRMSIDTPNPPSLTRNRSRSSSPPRRGSDVSVTSGRRSRSGGSKSSGQAASAASAASGTRQRSRNSTSGAIGAAPKASKKRQRRRQSHYSPGLEEEEMDEEEQQRSAFYLRHQNRALGSELRSFKRRLDLLEDERHARRHDCADAARAIDSLITTWTHMEASLCIGLAQMQSRDGTPLVGNLFSLENLRQRVKIESFDENQAESNNGDSAMLNKRLLSLISSGPPSTGEGKNVETVSSLLHSIATLSQSPLSTILPSRPQTNSNLVSSMPIMDGSTPHWRGRPPSQAGNHRIFKTDENDIVSRGPTPSVPLSTSHTLSDKVDAGEETDSDADTDQHNEGDSDGESDDEIVDPSKLAHITASVSERAENFKTVLFEFVQNVSSGHTVIDETFLSSRNHRGDTSRKRGRKTESSNHHSIGDSPILNVAALRSRIITLENSIREHETSLAELAHARDEASASERRVRRGLYRLASGRMEMKEVLKAVDMEEGSAFMNKFAEIESSTQAQADASIVSSGADPSIGVKAGSVSETTDLTSDPDAANPQIRKQLQDLEELASVREKKIEELLREREEHVKRINVLVLSKSENSSHSMSDDDIKKSSLYVEISASLATAERKARELRGEIEKWKNLCSVARGDVNLARRTINELEEKHQRRWKELTGLLNAPDNYGATFSDDSSRANGSIDEHKSTKRLSMATPDADKVEFEGISDATRIVELEHKLEQCLENVRQAETVRSSLTETNKMNESLQSKLDELKAKNAALVAGKSAARASSESSSHRSSTGSHSSSSSSVERLRHDHRRIRKELAAALASKDSAKSKQERAEKERDHLMKTNARLVKQIAEKDDVNAKSLSTILHLQHLTEEQKGEKEVLEQRVKGAEQLALAARLAANAKDRVHEEAIKEKELIEDEVKKSKDTIDSLMADKDLMEGRLAQSKAQMVSAAKDLKVARERCDELSSEITSGEDEKKRLVESVAVAKREATEAAKKSSVAASSSRQSQPGVNSEFTAEQLSTQVSVLKGRLACPVCNDRDKQCILLRCRHMFCRQCVDKNIKNRSRKCPACGQRFDMKDVGDVWL